MANVKIPKGEKLEVTIISPSGKTYLLTNNPIQEKRTLYRLDSDGQTLKKAAVGKTPPELYPKAI